MLLSPELIPALYIAASDIYAPVSGTIEEINEELGDQPALLNRSPEENGKSGQGCNSLLPDGMDTEPVDHNMIYRLAVPNQAHQC